MEEIESMIPLLEKQAEIIIKMLNADNHLAKIKADIQSISETTRSGGIANVADAYLYMVLKKLDIPLEKTIINVSYFSNYSSTKTISALSPFLFRYLHEYNKIIPATKDKDVENFEKAIRIMDKIMEIQRPVQLLAKEKLGDFEKVCKRERGIYAVLIPGDKKTCGGDEIHLSFYIGQKTLPNFSLLHLKSLAKYISNELSGVEVILTDGSSSAKTLIKEIDKVLASRAEMGDLESLKTKEKPKEKTSTLPSLDDLKLPK